MKWREPHALMTKYILTGGFCVLLFGLLILIMKSTRETGRPFSEERDILLFIVVGIFVLGGLLSGVRTVRFTEERITASGGQYRHMRNYKDIETAVVQEGSCNFEDCIVITFKLKAGAGIRGLNQIAVPAGVDWEPVMQIFRDKGVGVENRVTGERFG